MKSVLISIQPKWCKKIVDGEKTVEVRKTRPKLETPFKCYIYETKTKDYYAVFHEKTIGKVIGEFVCNCIDEYEMEGYDKCLEVYQAISKIVRDEDDTFQYTEASNDMSTDELSESQLLIQSKLTLDEIGKYVCGKRMFGFYTFYGWHISDLVIYDEPKELSEFIRVCEEWKKKRNYSEMYKMRTLLPKLHRLHYRM